jgi:hypothetical protein
VKIWVFQGFQVLFQEQHLEPLQALEEPSLEELLEVSLVYLGALHVIKREKKLIEELQKL